jgi:hypothetical protein
MRYVSTLKVTHQPETPPPAALMEAIAALGMEATRSGALVEFAGLMPVGAGGGRVTLAGGALTVTDGPFAESKEALGGFYLIEARDLDHAIELARLCPAGGGGVEVRPVLDTSSGPSGA